MHEVTGIDSIGQKQPFYMMFPFSDNLASEEEEEQDMQALVSMYPKTARRIWPEVEDVCDQLEYDGSMMFDECPDPTRIQQQVLKIQERVDGDSARDGRDIEDLIKILLFQEMHRRRRRRRRFKRHFIY